MAENYVKKSAPYTVHYLASVTIPANTPTSQKLPFTFTPDLTVPSDTYSYLQALSDEYLILKEVFAPSTPAIDGFIKFSVDRVDQGITLGLMSQTVRTLLHPVEYRDVLVVSPNSKLTPYYIPNSTSTVANTVQIEFVVEVVPKDYKGPI